MFIKSIELWGFKSYATRTVVGPFDSKFNAITGLNGSGKSNILDAICFVLGITSLQHVRVGNLQELVYKQGQAGVTKASVTITFDNSDPNQKPVGYESFDEITVCRQIVVGGRNKYLINGHNAQATQVANMFRSVQLNVNNPHFLIMQGRITKVLNMKPEEIRDMLQEVLGTLMYEVKKSEAEKKLSQKDLKVSEIENLLQNQITPRITKLREEKEAYLRFSAVQQELHRLTRFLAAWDYFNGDKNLTRLRDELLQVGELMENSKLDRKKAQADQKLAQKQLEDYVKRRNQDAMAPLEEAGAEEKKQGESLVRAAAARDNARETRDGEKASLTEIQSREVELKTMLESSDVPLEATKQESERAALGLREARAEVEAAARDLESAESGFGDSQVMEDAKAEVQTQTTNVKRAELKVEHAKSELKTVEADIKAETKGGKGKKASTVEEDAARQVELREELEGLQRQLGPEESSTTQSSDDASESPAALLSRLSEEAASLRAGLGKFNSFLPPSVASIPGVHGVVAKLVRLEGEEPEKRALALEVVAGGKLYNVVTKDVETGKKVLGSKQLKQRVTIIPVESIHARSVSRSTLDAAAKAAQPGSARLALEFIGASEELRKVVEYVFGSTLVCETIESARAAAFDKKVKLRTVTLEGDVFDPSGTLTGGSRAHGNASDAGLLLRLHRLSTLERELSDIKRAQELKSQESKKLSEIKSRVSRLTHELKLIESRVNDSKLGRLELKRATLQKELDDALLELKTATDALAAAKQRVKELEAASKDAASLRAKRIGDATARVSKTKKLVKEAETNANKALKKHEAFIAKIATGKEELVTISESIANLEVSLAAAEAKLEKCEAEFLVAREAYNVAKAKLDKRVAAVKEWDKEAAAAEKEASLASERVRDVEMEMKRLEGRVQKVQNDERDTKDALDAQLQSNPWILSERQFFGKEGTEWDFFAGDADEIEQQRAKLRLLEKSQSQSSHTVNKKALAMMDKAVREYDDLDSKRRIIERDRATIERVIAGLDKKKNEALVSTYEKVNKDFGSIFTSLLPGARAELRPPEGKTVLEGLEVRVAFGQTWKESLTELSGGQRSLLALSLVLALLRFKPAPMYILDEIDAALDLSHTQNIGNMLRQHFSQSQFIVVSLKEGMFANASCLFRTKFVDGVSTVSRTTNVQPAAIAAAPSRKRVKGGADDEPARSEENAVGNTQMTEAQ